jgi:CarboxypepD_reg-like domain/Thioredoxin-like
MIRWIFILLVFGPTAFCQQLYERTIIDKETGMPVPFASVSIVGTTKGTSSNIDGQFSISITQPVSLKISCIGYESLVVKTDSSSTVIELNPIITRLSEVVILNKPVNARKILRNTFAAIDRNYTDQSFLQKFFYRHYCKDDNTYGRLIEASVDVWKNQGYRSVRKTAGDREEIRVTQLRRSLDKTELAQGHEPISVGNILQADVVGYQMQVKNEHVSFYTDVSNLKIDFEKYDFACKAITYYDGIEVYKIDYSSKKDSVLTSAGNYKVLTEITGSLFVTTDTYAIVKTEEVKTYESNTATTTCFYRKYNNWYYPYHLIRDGESKCSDNTTHETHIELMSVEIKTDSKEKFIGHLPSRDELLNIAYDSIFWNNQTILKTTPLEDGIIEDLGGGTSLNKQFFRYRQYEMNLRDGGKNGEEKFNWLKEDSKGSRILYLLFWSANFQSYLPELELAKRLHKKYQNKITFVFISLDDDENNWQQAVQRFALFSDGIINYRIGSRSKITKSLMVKEAPSFVLLSRNGEVFDATAKRPSNSLLEQDFKKLLDQ